MVAPKRAALGEANKKLEGANKKLTGIRARVKELQDRVALLEESLMKATMDKNAAIAQVGPQYAQQAQHRWGERLHSSSWAQYTNVTCLALSP